LATVTSGGPGSGGPLLPHAASAYRANMDRVRAVRFSGSFIVLGSEAKQSRKQFRAGVSWTNVPSFVISSNRPCGQLTAGPVADIESFYEPTTRV